MPSLADAPDVLRDLAAADNVLDPHPCLARLRENHPVHRAPGGSFLVARYEDNMRGYGPQFKRPEPGQMFELFPRAARHSSSRMLAGTVTMLNPPEYTRLRRFFSSASGMRQVLRLQGLVDSICAGLLDAIEGPLRDGETVICTRRSRTPCPRSPSRPPWACRPTTVTTCSA